MRGPLPPSFFIYGEAPRTLDPHFVHVERVGDRRTLHGGAVRPHRHAHLHQLSLWMGGEGAYAIEGVPAGRVARGVLTWMPAGVVHGFDVSAEGDALVISLSQDAYAAILDGIGTPQVAEVCRGPLLLPAPPGEVDRLEALFRDLEREYRAPGWGQEEVMTAQLRLIFLLLARIDRIGGHDAATASFPQAALFGRFVDAIERRFRTEHGLDAYVALLNTTPHLLNRATRAATGQRASETIRARIIQEAKRLLLFTALEVGEVAATLGYPDPAHFTRLFRRSTGRAPRIWRNEERARMMAGAAGGDRAA